MAGYRSFRMFLIVFSAVGGSFAQDAPIHSRQSAATAPEKVPLSEVSVVQVPSLPAESIVMPVLCDADGGLLFRLAMPDTGVGDPVSVSSDGGTVTRYGKEKINDISRPVSFSMFLRGSEVYILTRGSIPLGYETKWRAPTGEVESHQASKSGTFVAHFERDGRYVGAVPLYLPFKPLHLGVFADGDFLISGADPFTSEPRVAIVGPNGQFRRLVELQGDVHAQEESGSPAKGKDSTALPLSTPWQGFAESLKDVVYTSQIAADGPNLLLFRPVSGPVFSISPSGEARAHSLQVRGNYRLFTIKATRTAWVAEFIHELPGGTGQEFATYSFDPESGTPLRQYLFPRDLGFGLACTDGDQFTFVMANDETRTLQLLKLAPGALPKSE